MVTNIDNRHFRVRLVLHFLLQIINFMVCELVKRMSKVNHIEQIWWSKVELCLLQKTKWSCSGAKSGNQNLKTLFRLFTKKFEITTNYQIDLQFLRMPLCIVKLMTLPQFLRFMRTHAHHSRQRNTCYCEQGAKLPEILTLLWAGQLGIALLAYEI